MSLASNNFTLRVGGNTVLNTNGQYLTSARSNGGYRIVANDGSTATSPVYTFYDDTDTGIGQSSADLLSLIAGGVSALTCISFEKYSTISFEGILPIKLFLDPM